MIKKDPQLNKNIVNKSHRAAPGERYKFSIRVSLMRINKDEIIENENGYRFQNGSNENGYRFHSYDSQVFLTTRTQSTTIPNTLISKHSIYIKNGNVLNR